jgi:Outer membrane efflux protein
VWPGMESREGTKTVASIRSHGQAAALLLCGLCLFASFSRARTNTPAPKVLKLEDALNYALQHYPAMRASLEQVTAAHSGVTLARTQYLPQLSGVYQVSRATQNQVPGIWLPTPITPTVEGPIGPSSDQSYWGSQAAALFSWEPFNFGLRSARVGQARSAEDRSRADLALTQLQVATAVGDYFLLAVANQQAVQAAQATVERWQVFDKSTHVLVDNELRPGADASRADAELARAKKRFSTKRSKPSASRWTLYRRSSGRREQNSNSTELRCSLCHKRWLSRKLHLLTIHWLATKWLLCGRRTLKKRPSSAATILGSFCRGKFLRAAVRFPITGRT